MLTPTFLTPNYFSSLSSRCPKGRVPRRDGVSEPKAGEVFCPIVSALESAGSVGTTSVPAMTLLTEEKMMQTPGVPDDSGCGAGGGLAVTWSSASPTTASKVSRPHSSGLRSSLHTSPGASMLATPQCLRLPCMQTLWGSSSSGKVILSSPRFDRKGKLRLKERG